MVSFEVFAVFFVYSQFIYLFVGIFFPFTRTDYFRNFVDSCLQKIPQDRPNSEELLKVSKCLCFIPVAVTRLLTYPPSPLLPSARIRPTQKTRIGSG